MEQKEQFEKKILTLFCIAIACCTVLIFRLYALSVDGNLKQAAANQSSYSMQITQTRGKIYDRNLRPLTDTEQHRLIAVAPTREAADACAQQITGNSRRKALDLLAQGTPFTLKLEQKEKVYAKDIENFTVSSRLPTDPNQQLAVHLLGYQDAEGAGVCGIEKAYDKQLAQSGETVQVRCRVNAVGQAVEGETMEVSGSARPVTEGVVLSIDKTMQEIVQKVGNSQIEQGAIVVTDIESGELRACASFPSYDPYYLEKAMNDERKPLINRALLPYCVGSSFKLAVAAAALEQGISPDFSIDCVGGTTVAGRIFYCHHRAGHRQTDLQRAIEQSCNPYFIRLGQKAGGEAVLGMAKALGFGKETILAPGIVSEAGTLPSLSDLNSPHELANFSFGQGKLTATPIQVASMVSAIANKGVSFQPKLVLGTTRDGKTTDYFPQQAPIRVFSEYTAAVLKKGMVGVVEQGSATMAKPQQGGAGGKTASAQTGMYDENGEEVVHAWFAGFFPKQQPKYAVVVLIEGGEYGGRIASPLFRQIADEYAAAVAFSQDAVS